MKLPKRQIFNVVTKRWSSFLLFKRIGHEHSKIRHKTQLSEMAYPEYQAARFGR
jgi:hypothetical protein